MKKFLTNMLAVLMLVVVGFSFVGCDEETPATPETPPAEAPAVVVNLDTTYALTKDGKDKIKVKLLSSGKAILVNEDKDIYNGSFVKVNDSYIVTFEGESSMEHEKNDFAEFGSSGEISYLEETAKHTFMLNTSGELVQITELATTNSEKIITNVENLVVADDVVNISDGLYSSKYYSSSNGLVDARWGDTNVYIAEGEYLYIANGFVTKMETINLGDLIIAKLENGQNIFYSIVKMEEIAGENYLYVGDVY